MKDHRVLLMSNTMSCWSNEEERLQDSKGEREEAEFMNRVDLSNAGCKCSSRRPTAVGRWMVRICGSSISSMIERRRETKKRESLVLGIC